MSAGNRFSRGGHPNLTQLGLAMEHLRMHNEVQEGRSDWSNPSGLQPPNLQMVPPPWMGSRDDTRYRPDIAALHSGSFGGRSEEPLLPANPRSQGSKGSFLPLEPGPGPEMASSSIVAQVGAVFEKEEPSVNKAVFRKQFKKTQMCRFFQRSACRKGEYCEFAHGPQELAQPPDLRRTSLCKAFMEGCCPESAETCRFAHGIAKLRRTPGFEKVVNKESHLEDDIEPMYGYESQQVHLHQMLRQQQREQEEMRQVIEEQRRKITELKMQQERLQQAQLASMHPLPLNDSGSESIPLLFGNQPTLLPHLGGGNPPQPHPLHSLQFKTIPL